MLRKKLICISIVSLFLLTVVSVTPVMGASPPNDFEDQVCSTGNSQYTITADNGLMNQRFTSVASFITKIMVKLSRTESVDSGFVLIGLTYGEQEKGKSFSYNSIPSSPGWVTVTFDSPIIVIPGTQPLISVTKLGGGDLCWHGGEDLYEGGASSVSSSFDFNFKTYGYNKLNLYVNHNGNNQGATITIDEVEYTPDTTIHLLGGTHSINANMISPYEFSKWGGLFVDINNEHSPSTTIDFSPSFNEHGISGAIYLNCKGVEPTQPTIPQGPSEVDQFKQATFTTSSNDINGDEIYYEWYWGDGSSSGRWKGPYASGFTATNKHTWITPGTYEITVKAFDVGGKESTISEIKTIEVLEIPNAPPTTPITPNGPETGEVGIEYSFSTRSTDPNLDQIKYAWDWNGDRVADEYSGYKISGVSCTMTKSWDTIGSYDISVKAIDDEEEELESAWSDVLTIEISEPIERLPDLIVELEFSDGSDGKIRVDLTIENIGDISVEAGSTLFYSISSCENVLLSIKTTAPEIKPGESITSKGLTGYLDNFKLGEEYDGQTITAIIDPIDQTDTGYGFIDEIDDKDNNVWSDEVELTKEKTKQFFRSLFEKIFNQFPILQQLLQKLPAFQQLL